MDSVPIRQTQTQTQVLVNSFVRSVYNWMAIGLALTGFVAYYVSNSQSMQNIIFGNPMVFYGLIIGELVMVFYLSARVNKMQASTATALFVLYAALKWRHALGGCFWPTPNPRLHRPSSYAPEPSWPPAFTAGPPKKT